LADYIYCTKKSSRPRMDVRVCQARCPDKEECRDLADFLKGRQRLLKRETDQGYLEELALTS